MSILFDLIIQKKDRSNLVRLIAPLVDLEHEYPIGASGNIVTPLIAAVKNNNVYMVSVLLKAGANIEHCDKSLYKDSPLSWSVWMGYTDITILLISYGANINYQTNFYHKTPLMWAYMRSSYDDFVLLVNRGADLTIDNVNKETVVDIVRYNQKYMSVINRYMEKIKKHIDQNIYNRKGADINISNLIYEYLIYK